VRERRAHDVEVRGPLRFERQVHEVATAASLGDGARRRHALARRFDDAQHGRARRLARPVDVRFEDVPRSRAPDEHGAATIAVRHVREPFPAGCDGLDLEPEPRVHGNGCAGWPRWK
jgi:hypothetical protein